MIRTSFSIDKPEDYGTRLPACAPVRVLPCRRPWPLYDVAGTRTIEAERAKQVPSGDLMVRAGLAVARWVAALAPHAQDIWFACGPGGNGGDGLHAAARLAQQGRSVRISLHAHPDQMSADAKRGLERARQAGARIQADPPARRVDVAVDALLGIGSRLEPRGAVLEGANALQRCGAPILAIDLPTGLDPLTGTVSRQAQVTAHATLALLTLRPGLFTGSGRDVCGDIWLEPLEINGPDTFSSNAIARLTHPDEHPGAWVARAHDSHKGRFGDVWVIGGAAGMTGAARLAAHAALASGAGRTFLTLLDQQARGTDPLRPEWLSVDRHVLADAAAWKSATVVCGCGGAEDIDELMPLLLNHASRLVIDADGLNALTRHPHWMDRLCERGRLGRGTVLTPHPLEAARLLACDTATVQADRLKAARTLAERLAATVVLKGSGTVICTPGKTTAVNSNGGPALAAGGSGDVLAGWLGGLWAQATQGAADLDALTLAHRVACSAVWLHGEAAQACPPHLAWRALDLIEAMRSVPYRAPAT